MTFTEALSAVMNDGDRVTRAHWNNRNIFLELHEEQVVIRGFSSKAPDDGLPHPWILTSQDYYAFDWEILADA